ncbi:hypothetical protein QFC22_002282 [Naganishia vaughanmartiniae]|uniref:Uncharacterized protein n=1 Tax=Naganishia vaughanmartiniae TaxID=1424756 RepID=A0ACC2XEH8_9TREE|nr:hypothetical protein QFC22_002282 [Naganishia vaughanmartiniae]
MSSRGRSPSPRSITSSTRAKKEFDQSGLTNNVRREHLEEIFGKYGRITGVDLPIFAKSGQNRGKAAIEYINAAAAEKARDHMDQDLATWTAGVDRAWVIEAGQVEERELHRDTMTTGTGIGMDRGLDESETMLMDLLVADNGTLIKAAPVALVDDRITEETGTILETGTAETVEDPGLMTDDDAHILGHALRHLVALCPHEADEIPDHLSVGPAAAADLPLGPRAEADLYDRTLHILDLLRGRGLGRVPRDPPLALGPVHEVRSPSPRK